MRFGLKAALCGVCVTALAACTGGKSAKPEFERAAVMSLVRSLSSDTLEGRGAGTQGSAQARALIVARLEALGIEPVNGSFEHPFTYGPFRTRGRSGRAG